MPGFFEALQNFPEVKKQKPTVLIDGKKHEVSLDLFKQIMAHGEDQYHIKDGNIVRKPVERKTIAHSKIIKGKKGHALFEKNMFWPTEVVDGGYEWTH